MRPARLLALGVAALAVSAGAPPAHAGCVEDYLGNGHTYVAPTVYPVVSVGGGVVTVDTNAAVTDVNNVATFGRVVVKNESLNAGDLADCVV